MSNNQICLQKAFPNCCCEDDPRVVIFRQIAEYYDKHMDLTGHIHVENYLLSGIRSSIKKTNRVLDIACGTGITSEIILKLMNPQMLVGLDICDRMLEKYGQRFQDNTSRIRLKQIDAEFLSSDLFGGEFDLIVIAFGVCWFDISKVIPILNSLLVKDGHIIVLDDVDLPEVMFSQFLPEMKEKIKAVRNIITKNEIERQFLAQGFKIDNMLHTLVSDNHVAYVVSFRKKDVFTN